MELSGRTPAPQMREVPQGGWISLWIVALISFVAQLGLCQFFSFGASVPLSLDVDPCNLWKYSYQWPPGGEFLVLNWLGMGWLPPPLNPFSLAAHLPAWLFFTAYAPAMSTLALLAMAAFLRELEISRPAALFGAVIFAWQGDLLPFVFPGHYGYIATWPFYALAAWGALRAQRTGYWVYALVSGAGCGVMVGLQPDRGAIASLLIAALFLAPAWRNRDWQPIRHLALCAGVAMVISLAAFLALFQSFIVGVSMAGQEDREQTYKFDTQFSLGPEETLTYLAPGFFGWHSSSTSGPYWGRIGQWPDWPEKHEGSRNLNLAVSTTGTVATVFALLAAALLLPGPMGRWLGTDRITERQRFFGRPILTLGAVALVLAWGYHTPLYRAVFALPLMDKWRNPLKWLEITNFAAVTLSALGAQHLLGTLPEDAAVLRRRVRLFLDGALAVLLLGLLATFPFTLHWTPVLEADGYQEGNISLIAANIHLSLIVAAGSMAAVCVLARLLWRPRRLRLWKLENPWLNRAWTAMLLPERLPLTLALGLCLLSVAQLGWVALQFIRPTSLAMLTATNPLLEALKSEGNTVRVSVSAQDPYLNVLLQNQMATPEISCLEISAASRIPDALNDFLGALADNPARLWLLAGVENRVVPQQAFASLEADPRIKANIANVDGYLLEPTESADLPSHALVHLKDYFAKATFVPGEEILPSDAAVLARVKDPKWNPRETVLLERPVMKSSVMLRIMSLPAEVNVTRYDAHRISLSVSAPRGGFVVINDAYDPDWQVTVNGRKAELLRADYMLRAVHVDGGLSAVSLNYVAHYRVGALSLPVETTNYFCDGAMLLAWLVAGVGLWRRRNSNMKT
jgi:hypothetical protein